MARALVGIVRESVVMARKREIDSDKKDSNRRPIYKGAQDLSSQIGVRHPCTKWLVGGMCSDRERTRNS
jgi:hypothetical protein